MAILPANLARVSNNLQTTLTQRSLSRTQQQLAIVQNQLSTGMRITLPSDDPSAAATVQQLKKTLANQAGYADNLKAAGLQLNAVDSATSDLTDLLRQAQTIASANVGSTSSADQRAAAAAVVSNLYTQALNISNTKVNGVYLFGGDRNNTAPFTSSSGGIQFVGSENILSNQVDDTTALALQVNGNQLFGGGPSRMNGKMDLTPAVTLTTRLSDLRGATGEGIHPGTINISDGTTTKAVDLSHADTIGDVVNAINAAGVGGLFASVTNTGINITSGGSDQMSITEAGSTTAADLGILQTTPLAPGSSLGGLNAGPMLTPFTNLADLRNGLGIDTSGPLVISNGSKSVSIDLSTINTVQDLMNQINASGTGARAQISADGSRLDVLNTIQGLALSIGPGPAGGAASDELGIRTFSPATLVSTLNGGQGIHLVPGNDIEITRSDGSKFQVDLDGAATAQDVIDAINTADAGIGLVASFNTQGNGIVLSDATGTTGPTILSINGSTAAADLGLTTPAANGVLTGKDVGGIPGSGLFAHLAALRDSLLHNDPNGITRASTGLDADLSRVVLVRGQVGAQSQDIQARQNQIDDHKITLQAMLSNLEDTDYNDAITRFQTLQTALQANLQSAAKMLNQSLLDFLQ
jgi:flagellar hook-associated protein 3